MRIIIETKVKRELDISFGEYVVLNLIYRRSTNPNNPTPGWCLYEISEMQEELGLNEQELIQIMNRLLKRELLEKSHDNLLHVTQAWSGALRKSKKIKPLI